MKDPAFKAGRAMRRRVLGAAHVDRAEKNATAFDKDFQEFITRYAWGGVWTRKGLDPRTRSLLTIAILAALGQEHELALHLRATRNTKATPADIREALFHVAVYAGAPRAVSAFRVAKAALEETAAEAKR